MDLQRLHDNLSKLDILDLAEKILLDKFMDKTVKLNLNQLLSGEGGDNQSLPRYVDDPYFKTKEAALRYQAWKAKISPNSKKPQDVMDFYINGRFHGTIFSDVRDSKLIFDSTSEIKNSVLSKTDGAALGLNTESLEELRSELLPILIEEIESAILQ